MLEWTEIKNLDTRKMLVTWGALYIGFRKMVDTAHLLGRKSYMAIGITIVLFVTDAVCDHSSFCLGSLICNFIPVNKFADWTFFDFVGYIEQGRKEILSLLNRKKYKEMLLTSLEKTKLRFSPLDTRFLLRDLIGSGHVKTVQTPTGLLVRISRD